ncbi:Glutaminase kidney isoform, mitochondrial [Bagarius yarrelli]|uniref:glutaminase n=1 Tax=Bagarius yarrelli TaxID=175774 RepID=A0A556U3U6_BAGYA|nr:Glutaminase kidney isoform, mitochondrial [Bagarius yarrelli]
MVDFIAENIARNGALGLYSDSVRRLSQQRCFSNGSSQLYFSRSTTERPEPEGSRAGEGLFSGLEDLLFHTITDGQDRIPISHFFSAIKRTGLLTSDPRLRDCMDKLRQAVRESRGDVMMDHELFRRCVGGNIVLLSQAFRKKFIIPEFDSFVTIMNQIYNRAKEQHEGRVAHYIPHLAKFSPNLWGISLCTVDGQRHSKGDTKLPFCLQSCVKPLEYAIAVHEHGTEHVHRYVGKEPSGLKFNMLSLDDDDKPHNPMVNAGAIVISSLIKVMDFVKKMAGREYVGFNNATFQSEKETGDRNFAIGYYLKEKKCFPPGADMIDALDFYFQRPEEEAGRSGGRSGPCPKCQASSFCHGLADGIGRLLNGSEGQLCSIEVTCESGSVMAATLANGGICPITGEQILSSEAVRNTLSLMHSCGMYDYSGYFAFHELVSHFNFHNYDNLRHFVKKQDPRRQSGDERNKSVVNLMFAAHSGDVSALRRFALSSMDMDQKDYDHRTALHVAAAEGHVEVVRFLTETCKVNPFVKDRWGNIPLDDALQSGQDSVVTILQKYQQACGVFFQQKTNLTQPHDSKRLLLDGILYFKCRVINLT